MSREIDEITEEIAEAVRYYWKVRNRQYNKQLNKDKTDTGFRSAVTGGAQLDGFINLFARAIRNTGIEEENIYFKSNLQIPGFYRPTKEWDLLVIKDKMLIAAIEAKSQAGPSFGNNFNNRTEEALGSAVDLWTAFREGAFQKGFSPFLGYFFLLEDSEGSNKAVSLKEPHFRVFSKFNETSYKDRYKILCQSLVMERQYTSCAFLTSSAAGGLKGVYNVPDDELSVERFVKVLQAHIKGLSL